MIIDNHVHVFPDQAGSDVGPDPKAFLRQMQRSVRDFWGKMITSHQDPRYIPGPDEDVGFRVGSYGRYQWRKHGEDCWLQRGPAVLARMEHLPEQMLAHMDSVGVDMGVIQAEYMEPNWGRERYFAECIRRWPDRFIGAAAIEYDLAKDDRLLQQEVHKLTRAVEELGFKALFVSHIAARQPFDDRRFAPLWKEVVRLGVPAYINTGHTSKAEYLAQVGRLENVLQAFPELNVIDSHVGAHLRHPRDPEHVDNPREFYPLFRTGRFFLEVGYVLAYENFAVWGRDYQYPYPRHQQIIQTIYEQFGAGVLVWGSDMPWAMRTCTYRQDLDLVRLHTDFMTEADRRLVLGGNLAHLFKLPAARLPTQPAPGY
ncbi:MAG: amidohydrolase family protein [Chloroflexi bacterium]|nr:amidohydrolase family protein [Chloroflexota bacterium]